VGGGKGESGIGKGALASHPMLLGLGHAYKCRSPCRSRLDLGL